MFRKIAAFAASLLVFCLAMLAGATPASANVKPEQAPVCSYHTETKRPIEVPCAQPYGATPDGIQMNNGEFCPLGSYVTADLNWCLTEAMVKDGWSSYDDGTVNESEIDFSYLSSGELPLPTSTPNPDVIEYSYEYNEGDAVCVDVDGQEMCIPGAGFDPYDEYNKVVEMYNSLRLIVFGLIATFVLGAVLILSAILLISRRYTLVRKPAKPVPSVRNTD